MPLAAQKLIARLVAAFGEAPGRVHVIRAPGRVNLIGEHTDYNDGFVLPMAIEPHVLMACRGREDARVRIVSTHFPEALVEFSVEGRIERGEPSWANYFRGVAAELRGAGIPLTGMDLIVDNTLPVGGGLSSSAALLVGASVCFLTLSGVEVERGRLALLCQKAEHEYAGLPTGIMDQTIVATARADHALLLDCRNLQRHYVPIDASELRVVIVNTMVKHELNGTEYADRRRECEQGVAYFQTLDPAIKALRDVTLAQVVSAEPRLPPVVFMRCRHVVTEIARTTAAAKLLDRRQYEAVGTLMYESHASLREDYQVSTAELDFLVSTARGLKGVYGARMTGGGFGGCIVALVQPRHAQAFAEQITARYEQAHGQTPAIYTTAAVAGTSVVI